MRGIFICRTLLIRWKPNTLECLSLRVSAFFFWGGGVGGGGGGGVKGLYIAYGVYTWTPCLRMYVCGICYVLEPWAAELTIRIIDEHRSVA